MKKRLFIIAPHFPPSSLPPAQRVRMLAAYLPVLDVKLTFFTTYSKYREEKEDEWMLKLAGNQYDLITLKACNQKITRKFGIGDLGLRMLPFLFFRLWKECKKQKPDLVLYPVPPWYILLIAPLIKKLTHVPYAIDFIDPWVEGGQLQKDAKFKRRISQKIARKFERKVTRDATIIYAVSEGINQQLIQRHPILKNTPMYAIPYGADPKDFSIVNIENKNRDYCLIRYIGAVWDDAYPVLEALFKAFPIIKKNTKIEFIGTGYAGGNLAKRQLDRFIKENNLQDFLNEKSNRVPYKQAVSLTKESDILLLFGGMQAYYAASKLFGLIVSQKPFFALLHRDSFPAKFLKDFDYPYLVEYSEKEGDLPNAHLSEIKDKLEYIKRNFKIFQPLDIRDERIQKHTAMGMSKAFLQAIEENEQIKSQ